MKGLISVDIPTKRYIAAYVRSKLGQQPIMNVTHNIGSKLYDVLMHSTDEDRHRGGNVHYTTRLRVYVNLHTWRQRGAFLNYTNIKRWNTYIEEELKDRFHFLMDFYIDILPNFEAHLPEVRRRLGISIDDWSDDSMRKDYWRYRKETGKPLLYNKNKQPITHHRVNKFTLNLFFLTALVPWDLLQP